MAITLNELPGPLCMVRHPQHIKATTDDVLTDLPTSVNSGIVFQRAAVAGETVTVELAGQSWTFTAATSPDQSGLQFAIGANATAQATAFAAAFRLHHAMHAAFDVYTNAGEVSAYLRSPAAGLQAAWTPAPVDLATVLLSAPCLGPVYRENMRLGLRLRVKDRNTYPFLDLPELSASPTTRSGARWATSDPIGEVKWNVAPLLKPYCAPTWPGYSQEKTTVKTTLVTPWTAWVFEVVDGTPRKLVHAGDRLAWFAGLRTRDRISEESLVDFRVLEGSWLTYRGRRDKLEVSPAQPVWLLWFKNGQPGDTEQFILKADIAYTDGTTDADVTLYTRDAFAHIEAEVMHLWAAGYQNGGVDDEADPAKTVLKYTLWIESSVSGNPVSDELTLWVVEADANERHLDWVSSLGGIESLRTTGGWQLGTTLTLDEAMAELPLLPAAHDSAVRTVDARNQETLQLSTGWVDRYELAALVDFLHSPEIRLRDQGRNRWLPVRMTAGSHLVKQQGDPDTEHLYALNLELLVGDDEGLYSDVLALSSDGSEPAPPPGGDGDPDE